MRLLHVLERSFLALVVTGAAAESFAQSTVIISDTFTGTEGTALTAHAPDTNPLNRAWTVVGAQTAAIRGQRAGIVAGTSGYITALIDGRTPNVMVSTQFVAGATPAAGTNYAALLFRYSDPDNHFRLRYYNRQLNLFSVIAGVYTSLWQGNFESDLVPGSTHVLSAILSGSTIQVLWDNGALVGNASGSFNIAATKYGVDWIDYYDAGTAYDNFSITGVLAPAAATTAITPAPTDVLFAANRGLTAAAYDAGNAVIPDTAFQWSTSNAAIATVTALSASTAYVQGTGTGTVTITATPTRGPSSTSVVTVNPGDTILFDSFSAANGTAIGARQPEVDQTFSNWSVTGGSVLIQSNTATFSSATSYYVDATVDGGTPNATISVDWIVPASTSSGMIYGGLRFRQTDAHNYFMVRSVGAQLDVFRVVNDVWTLLGYSVIADPRGATHNIQVQLSGASIQVMWDHGAQIVTVYDNFNLTARFCGVAWYPSYDTTTKYDNFSVKGTIPDPTTTAVTPATSSTTFHSNLALTAHGYDSASVVMNSVVFDWTSSNPAIATVTATSSYTANLYAVGLGTVTITATPMHGPAATATITVTPGSTIVYDSFIAADGISVASHSPEVNQPGGAWTITGGPAPTISSERAAISSGSGTVTAIIEGSTPNATVGVSWTPGANPAGGANYGGLIFRRSDANNFFYLGYWNRYLQLWRVMDGNWTSHWHYQLEEEPSLQPHRLEVELAGQSIQVRWDGGAEVAYINDQFNSNATKYGIQWSALYDAGAKFDNFSITGTLPPIPTTVAIEIPSNTIPFHTGRWAVARGYDPSGALIPGVAFTWASSNAGSVTPFVGSASSVWLAGLGSGSSTISAHSTRGGPTGTTVVNVDPGSTIVFDSFQGSNGTALAAHAPEVAQLGGSWTVTGGNGVSLQNGRATANATANPNVIITALIDTSMSDGRITVSWNAGGAPALSRFAALKFRATDEENFFYAEYWGESVYLWRVTPAGWSVAGQAWVGDAGATTNHSLGVKMIGSLINVMWDDAAVVVVADPFNQGATRVGLIWWPVYSPAASYDNFSVTGTLPPFVNTLTMSSLSTPLAPYDTTTLTAQAQNGSGSRSVTQSFGGHRRITRCWRFLRRER